MWVPRIELGLSGFTVWYVPLPTDSPHQLYVTLKTIYPGSWGDGSVQE